MRDMAIDDMRETRGSRLKQARLKANIKSARQAAALFDIPRSTYTKHELAGSKEGRDYDEDQAKRYARVYGVSYLWLLHGKNLREIKSTPVAYFPRMVPVIGRVGAGDVGHFYEETDFGEIEGPLGSTAKTVAVQVQGYSMEGVADDGSYLFYDDEPSPPDERHIGKLCVLWLEDGRVIFKKLVPTSDPQLWNCISTNGGSVMGVRVLQAVRVRQIVLA